MTPLPRRKRRRPPHNANARRGKRPKEGSDNVTEPTGQQLRSGMGDDSELQLFVADSVEVEGEVVQDSIDGALRGPVSHVPHPPIPVPRTPTRVESTTSRSSPVSSPQRAQKTGFSEPVRHPTRQPPYKRPRFKPSEPKIAPHSPESAVPDPRPHTAIDEDDDMDEGAAGVSSDGEGSTIMRRLVSEGHERHEQPVQLQHSGVTANYGRSADNGPRNLIEDADTSVVPDSQPTLDSHVPNSQPTLDSQPSPDSQSAPGSQHLPDQPDISAQRASHPLQPSARESHGNNDIVPVDSVLNTSGEVLSLLSPPSALTASTQELSQASSREYFIRWLRHSRGRSSYTFAHFLEKYCGFVADSSTASSHSPLLHEALASYVVGHDSQVDSAAKMQGRHKALAHDASLSLEKFFRRILYDLRMHQKNAMVESEIIYGPWRDLVRAVGRPMVVFTLLYSSVYKPVGESQWLQISGDVPRYQQSCIASPQQLDQQPKFVTKRDIVFREFRTNSTIELPSMTPRMLAKLPPDLQRLISKVEQRARPMRFLFKHVGIRTEGWTPRQAVTKFLMLCTKKLFPRAILGSVANDIALEKTVRRFVNMSATAKLPLGQASHGIRIRDLSWLQHNAAGRNDAQKHEVLLLFLEWMFENFLKPMLARHFYMTEMSGVAVSLYYYELSVWIRKIKSAGTKAFIEQHGGKEKLVEGSDGQHLRFVPKQTGGVRPIVNLRDFNQSLKFAHVVLQSLPRSRTRLESWQSWFLPLEAFKLRQTITPGGKYYVVKLDISGCYDNLNKQKLEDVVRKHLSNGEMEYWLQTHSVFDSRTGSIRDKQSATPASDIFAAAATNDTPIPLQPSKRLDRSLLVFFSRITGNTQIQGSRLPPEKRLLHGLPYSGDEVLDDLMRLVHELKIGVRPLKLLPFSAGIPQGSSCSLDLCNLLLDDLVHTQLTDFIDDPRCLLLRYVDDFLFVSTSKELAESYQAIMLRGFAEEYGVACKEEKQQTNLGGKVSRMEYLGYEFDPNTLELYPRKLNVSASAAPLPVYKGVLLQRMHVNLESLLGPLRMHRRAGIYAPALLEKRVSRAFGRFVADSLEACRALVNERDAKTVFTKLARMKLLPLVPAERRTSVLKAAQNLFLIRQQKKARSVGHINEAVEN